MTAHQAQPESGARRLILLDGPMGTELLARGVPTHLPGWSAHALDTDPHEVSRINTFRTTPRVFPERWRDLTRGAVNLARGAAPKGHLIAGSIAPVEDCYRPDLSPPDARRLHELMARALVETGCDLLLCETFPHVGEALAALSAALGTGLPVWVGLTPGYRADLLTPSKLAEGGRQAASEGASAVLVNCVPAARGLEYLAMLRDAVPPPTRVGIYANTGVAEAKQGWETRPVHPEAYADLAEAWFEAGASILGGCCGTGVPHIAALAARFT